jgi:hypothetical protein
MEKRDSNNLGGLDIEENDVYRNESERDLKNAVDNGEIDPDENANDDAVKAGLRYRRDNYVVKSDVDPDEDNYAPGVKEQD